MPRGSLLVIVAAARVAPQFRAEDLPPEALPPRGGEHRPHQDYDPRYGMFGINHRGGMEVLDRQRAWSRSRFAEEEREVDREMHRGERLKAEARKDSAFVEGFKGRELHGRQQQGFRALALLMEQARVEGRLGSLGIFGMLKDMAGALLSTKEVIPGDYPYMCVCNPPMQMADGTIKGPKSMDPICPTDSWAMDCFVKREYREKEAAWKEELPHPKMIPEPLGPPDGYLQTGERPPSFEHELRSSFASTSGGGHRGRDEDVYHLPEAQIQAILADTKVQMRALEAQLAMPLSAKIWRAFVVAFMYFAKFFLLATGLFATVVVMRMRKQRSSSTPRRPRVKD